MRTGHRHDQPGPAGVAIFVTVLLLPAFVRAQQPDVEAARLAPLRHVERVGVLVEDLTRDAERLSITRGAIQADAELRLRRAGLRVDPEPTSSPTLYVQVSVVCDRATRCAIDVSSAVIQDVYLHEAPTETVKAKTWQTGEVLLAPAALVERSVLTAVRAQADALAGDVLAARRRAAP